MVLHPRAVLPLLRRRLASRPVTVLTGARQTGKTTLVRDLLPAAGEPQALYLSLDDPDERLRLGSDPVRRLDHGTRLVILDEVQKLPALLDAVKFLADRRRGSRFVLLGSSQILLLERVRESLAGRAALVELWPLALIERVDGPVVPESLIDHVWRDGEASLERAAAAEPSAAAARTWRARADDHLRWGGFPALEPLAEEDRTAWLRDFRRTYLERDLADLGRVADLDQFALAQTLLAARTAQLLSFSEVARDLGVAVNTAKRYVRFLEVSYQLYLARPHLPNVTTRLVKSPKLYWTDPGLARLLSQRLMPSDGSIYETVICGELLRWSSWQPNPPDVRFFRTHGGREIDFVVAGGRRTIAVEAKAGERAGAADARPLDEFVNDPAHAGRGGAPRLLGLLVTRGRQLARLAPNVWVVPWWRLFGPAAM